MSSNNAQSESVAGHGGEIWNDSVHGDQQAWTFLGTPCFLALGALSGENFGKFCALLAEVLETPLKAETGLWESLVQRHYSY